MNVLDLIIILFVLTATIGGYRLGLLMRAASWVGLTLGIIVASHFAPDVISSFADEPSSNKLLIARPVDPHGKADGNYLVAVDTVDAGFGETVLIVSGSSARMASGMKDCPVDAAIVGIVDTVQVKDA